MADTDSGDKGSSFKKAFDETKSAILNIFHAARDNEAKIARAVGLPGLADYIEKPRPATEKLLETEAAFFAANVGPTVYAAQKVDAAGKLLTEALKEQLPSGVVAPSGPPSPKRGPA